MKSYDGRHVLRQKIQGMAVDETRVIVRDEQARVSHEPQHAAIGSGQESWPAPRPGSPRTLPAEGTVRVRGNHAWPFFIYVWPVISTEVPPRRGAGQPYIATRPPKPGWATTLLEGRRP